MGFGVWGLGFGVWGAGVQGCRGAGVQGCRGAGVVGLKHKQSNTDWTTTITVQPCADEILGSLINKTYAENTKASAIVRDLLNIFGVEVAKCELSIDKSYPRGRVCRGKLNPNSRILSATLETPASFRRALPSYSTSSSTFR